MTGEESVLKNLVQRMLDAGKALCRIIVLVVDVDVVVLYSLLHIVGEHALVHIGFCGLGSELHHHSGRSVSVHVRVLAGDLGRLGVDDLLEDLA